MKKNRGDKRKYIERSCALIVSVFIIALFVVKEITLPEEREYGDTTYGLYEGTWQLINSEGIGEEIELPCQLSVDADYQQSSGDYKYVLETQLSIVETKDTWMSFSSQKQDIYVYVGDELRLEHNTENSRPFGKSSPFIRTFIHLTPSDNGKNIRIELIGNNNYTGRLPEIYVGTQLGIFRHIIEQEMRELFLSFGILLLGLSSAVIGLVLRKIYKRELPLEPLGWLVFFAGLWVLVESDIKQFMFSNTSMAGEMTFLCLMMIPVFMSQYIDSAQQGRYHKWYAPSGYAAVANVVICVVLQLMEIAQLQSLFPITVVLMVVDAGIFITTVIIDSIKKQTKSYFLEIMGIAGCVLAGFLEVVIYYVIQPESMDGSILCLGLIFMISMSLIKTFQIIKSVEVEKREALELSKAKDNFLANMSHEIRTPINAVLGMDKMILRETNQKTVREYAIDIQNAGNNLLTIINEILDFSKIESGKIKLVEAEYELNELLISAYQLVRNRAEDKKLALTFAIDPSLPSKLYGDEVRVRQVIVNLLTNGIKYTEKGLVTLKVRGTRESEEDDRIRLSIEVEDTGIGIRPEDMKKLFGSFQRLDERRNRNVEGTGLGLAITREFAVLMGGDVKVESTYGKGSIFTAYIQQKITDATPLGVFDKEKHSREQEEDMVQFTCPEGKILVVDDVPMNLKVVKGLLKDTLLQIDTAGSGAECLKKFMQQKYDIIFLDHMMPGMDGEETRMEMSRLDSLYNNETPVIMLTANAVVGAKDRYIVKGFADYISKPIRESELRSKILSFLPKELVMYRNVKEQEEHNSEDAMEKALAEILNTEEGLMYAGGEMDFYVEIIETYCQENRGEKLSQLLWAEDYHGYQIEVHAMKSTSYSIGANAVADLAKELEEACKNGEKDFVQKQHGLLIEKYEQLVNEIRDILTTFT